MAAQHSSLILVDGSSYLYRAFHALPALTNSKGFPTGAVYGMINMLKRLMADYKPQLMTVVFDAKGKTFRDEIYTAYKATRQPMPSDLSLQIETIHAIIKAMGIPILVIEGVEADDVIGTLAAHATQAGLKTVISTGDKDLAQLVNSQVTLINTMTNLTLDEAQVKAKFGVPPDRIIDYLTLIGDTSDNIPGVPLVGPKTAAKWLQQYGSLQELSAHAAQITGKAGENLRASLSQFPLVKDLVTIKKDVPLPVDFTDLGLKEVDKAGLITLFKEMEFKTWLSELLEELKETQTLTQHADYKIITQEKELAKLVKKLAQSDLITFTIVTTSLNYMAAEAVGIAFAFSPGNAYYIPISHDLVLGVDQLTPETVLTSLRSIFENNTPKLGHNLKYCMEILARHQIKLGGTLFDVMIESYVLESASNNHDLHSLALKYLGWRTTPYEEIAGKGAKQKTFNQLKINEAFTYTCELADVIYRLHALLWPRIQKETGLVKVFEQIEMPLIEVLANLERNGVLIDPIKLQNQGKELQKRLLELENQTYSLAGKAFNLNSPKQLQEILFDILKLPILQKTPKGQASTADNVLQELALEFALPRLIIEHRSLSKLMSTYTNRLIEQIDKHSGRVHTFYNQTITTTGRLSSSEPNLQNIPIRTVEGRRIRQAFIAPQKNKIVSADYSQIELRLMAHISQDPNLIKAFTQNLDIHTATAAEVWGVAIDKVTPDMRRNAKAINFGLIYGMSAFGLSRQLNIKRKASQEYIDKYFSRYPKVKEYMDNTRIQAKEKGFVETLWGRRLYLPDINASQIMRQKAAERAAINAPLQGSAADIIKLAMINIHRWIQQNNNISIKMIMQVHDELVFEVAENQLEEAVAQIRAQMSTVTKLTVPLLVSVGIGDNWDAASAH